MTRWLIKVIGYRLIRLWTAALYFSVETCFSRHQAWTGFKSSLREYVDEWSFQARDCIPSLTGIDEHNTTRACLSTLTQHPGRPLNAQRSCKSTLTLSATTYPFQYIVLSCATTPILASVSVSREPTTRKGNSNMTPGTLDDCSNWSIRATMLLAWSEIAEWLSRGVALPAQQG